MLNETNVPKATGLAGDGKTKMSSTPSSSPYGSGTRLVVPKSIIPHTSSLGLSVTTPSEGKSWFKNIPYFIAQKVARQDFVAVSNALQLIPLKFRSSEDETRFFHHLLTAYGVRIRLSACIGGIVFVSFWTVCGVAIGTNIYPIGEASFNIIFFHTIMFCIVLTILGFYSSSLSSRFQAHLETVLHIVVIVVVLLPLVWLVTVTAPLPANSSLNQLDLEQLVLWTCPFVLGVPLWNFVLINLFMQTRTRASFIPQIIIIGILIILNITQATLAVNKEATRAIADHYNGPFLIVVAAIECWSLLCVLIMCYFGRWNLELQERIEFWKFSKSNDHLQELRESQSKRKKRSGSTAVEDLLHIIIRAMTGVQEAEVSTGNKLLVESTEILRQIQDILTNTDNLYAVRLQSEHFLNNSQQVGLPIDPESAILEAKFYEIYANKRMVSYQPLTTMKIKDNAANPSDIPTDQMQAVRLRPGTDIKIRNLAPPPKADADFRRGVGREWSCNILRGSHEYPNILVEVGALLLEPKSVHLGTSPIRIRNYVYRIERLYRRNPYHNSAHGAMVAHTMSCLLKMLGISEAAAFTPLDSVAVIIASLGHDAGHPGRNNQFYVNAFQRMALLYNDKSVLENYHTALVFKSLEPRSCGIFDALDPETVRDVRKKIIDLILATDMGQHFESVSKFRLRRQAAGFNLITDLEDMWLVIRMCIKCADLSHALVDWTQHQEWSVRVVEEFYQQGEEEALLGLPKSPLCDRTLHHEFAKSQKGFIEFVVQPLLSQMDELDREEKIADNCLKHLTYNKYKWEEMYRDKRSIDIPDHIQEIRTDSHACRLLLLHLFVPKGYTLCPIEGEAPLERLKGRRGSAAARRLRAATIRIVDIDQEEQDEDESEDSLDEDDDDYSSSSNDNVSEMSNEDQCSQTLFHTLERKKTKGEESNDNINATDESIYPINDSTEPLGTENLINSNSAAAPNSTSNKNSSSILNSNKAFNFISSSSGDKWLGERSSTLETARFGGESFDHLLEDMSNSDEQSLSSDIVNQQTHSGNLRSTSIDPNFWDDEDNDENEASSAQQSTGSNLTKLIYSSSSKGKQRNRSHVPSEDTGLISSSRETDRDTSCDDSQGKKSLSSSTSEQTTEHRQQHTLDRITSSRIQETPVRGASIENTKESNPPLLSRSNVSFSRLIECPVTNKSYLTKK